MRNSRADDDAPNRARRMGSGRGASRTARRMALLAPGAALLIASCALPSETSLMALSDASVTPAPTASASDPTPSALKPVDPAVFQSAVERAAKKLMVPGAVVLLRTPRGTFRATVGTTELGTARPPTTGDHFRIASNTKTMTSALIILLAQEGRLRLSDPVSAYVSKARPGRLVGFSRIGLSHPLIPEVLPSGPLGHHDSSSTACASSMHRYSARRAQFTR